MMDQRELSTCIAALSKAITDKEPAANVIAIMDKLKNDVQPTEELLRATKAGMVIAKQRGNPNKEIGKLATEIVTKWKKTVEAEKLRKTKSMAASSPKKEAVAASPVEADTNQKGYVGDKTKRKWETDKVDIKRTGVPTRDSCIGLLYNGIAFQSEESPLSIVIKAVEVEAAAFEIFKGENAEYKKKLRSLFQNLKIPANSELRLNIMSGDISAHKFVTMTDDELKNPERKKEDALLNAENMKMAQVPMAEKSISDALRCGRCGQKKVSYSQAQTRSADEPMTTFCECTVCGNRWKFS